MIGDGAWLPPQGNGKSRTRRVADIGCDAGVNALGVFDGPGGMTGWPRCGGYIHGPVATGPYQGLLPAIV